MAELAPAKPSVDPDVARDLGLDERGNARRWAWRIGLVVAVIGLAVGGVLLYRAVTAAPAERFRTGAVARQDVEAIVEATGTVEPLRTVQVGPEVSGRVVAVHVEENDRVAEGQVLAEIDPLPIEARRREAEAQLRAARAQLRQAQATRADAVRTRARYEPLEGTGAIAGRELDQARAAVEQADAQVDAARAQIAVGQATLASIATDLERTSVRAPVDGVVLERIAEPGQAVAAAFQPPTLFVIAEDLTRMELRLAVDEADIGRVEPGQRARFTVDAFPDRTFAATVRSVRNAPRTVSGVVTYEVVLGVDNREGLLRPGMTANADVITARRADALAVPNAALRFTPPGSTAPSEGPRVWVERAGAPVAIPVTPGITDGRVTVVEASLAPGDEVLVDVARPEDEDDRAGRRAP